MADTPKTVNYQALYAMDQAAYQAFISTLRDFKGILCLAGVLVVIAVEIVIKGKEFAILYLTCFLYVGYLVGVTRRYKNSTWQRFAEANGWQIDTGTAAASLIPPRLSQGEDQQFSPVIQAQLGSVVCDLFEYNFTVGFGRSATTYYFTVAAIPMPYILPHLLLLGKHHRYSAAVDIPNYQTLKLEGNFNDHFTLHIEAGQQINALEIITPDVMQTLLDYSENEDIEILDNYMYFLLNSDNRDPDSIRALVESVVHLTEQIIENARLSVGSGAQPTLEKPVAVT